MDLWAYSYPQQSLKKQVVILPNGKPVLSTKKFLSSRAHSWTWAFSLKMFVDVIEAIWSGDSTITFHPRGPTAKKVNSMNECRKHKKTNMCRDPHPDHPWWVGQLHSRRSWTFDVTASGCPGGLLPWKHHSPLNCPVTGKFSFGNVMYRKDSWKLIWWTLSASCWQQQLSNAVYVKLYESEVFVFIISSDEEGLI